jgi:hypothetical protein
MDFLGFCVATSLNFTLTVTVFHPFCPWILGCVSAASTCIVHLMPSLAASRHLHEIARHVEITELISAISCLESILPSYEICIRP